MEVLNPFEFKTMPTDKTFVLDLKVMLNDNSILNFEVQVVDEKDWPERSLTYACRTFDQLKKGESYLDVKPVRHIGFLDYDLKDFTPEFYATYQLLNIKNREIYTGKFALSVVNLNQIELATEEDRIRRGQEIRIERAEATIAKKEAIIAEKDAAIVEMDGVIAEKEEVIAAKDAEIARLKALLTAAKHQ